MTELDIFHSQLFLAFMHSLPAGWGRKSQNEVTLEITEQSSISR